MSAATERLYERLPALYRDADERQADGPNGYPLLRYISLIVDQLGEVEDLVDRVDYVPAGEGGQAGDTSDLADPQTADIGWLQWLGQLVGVTVEPRLTEVEARDAVAYAPAGWRSGTKVAVVNAARSALTGTRYARIYDHQTDTGPGTTFDLLVVTLADETPDPSAVLDAIERKRARPAGTRLYHRTYGYTYAALASGRSYADVAEEFATYEELRTHMPPEELT